MKLHEKIKNMTVEELSSTLVLMTIRDNDSIKEIATSTEELLQFMIEVLEQEVEEDDDLEVCDIKIDNDVNDCEITIRFLYEDRDIGDCEYSLSIGDMQYDDATGMAKRAVYAYSDGMDTYADKTTLYRILNSLIKRVVVVD